MWEKTWMILIYDMKHMKQGMKWYKIFILKKNQIDNKYD